MASNQLSIFAHLTSGYWPAWVRTLAAIGTIAAVLCALWLWPDPALKARRKRILAIAESGLLRAKQIGEAFARPSRLDIPDVLYVIYYEAALDGIVQSLENVSTHEIGSRDAVIALSNLRDQFRFLGTSIQIFETPIKDPGTIKKILALDEVERRQYLAGRQPTLAKNVRDRLAGIQRDYDELVRALNGTWNSSHFYLYP
jgi:hypothetical protein